MAWTEGTLYGDKMGSISATVATLPAGNYVGEERMHEGLCYRLAYNTGNSEIGPGYGCVSTWSAGASPSSVTVSTVTESSLGNVGVNQHSTVATGYYFWMAYKGYGARVTMEKASGATGSVLGLAANGAWIATDNTASIYGVNVGDKATSTATTLTPSGRVYIDFTRRHQYI